MTNQPGGELFRDFGAITEVVSSGVGKEAVRSMAVMGVARPFKSARQERSGGARRKSLCRPLGIDGDDLQIGFRRLVRLGSPLFPIAQGAKRDAVAVGKLFLGEAKRAADDFYLRHAGSSA